MSTTLAAARAEVSKRAQEFISGTATSGSTTTLADTTNLNYVDSYWAEATVLMTSGTNAGQSRRVQTYTGNTLTFYSAMTGAVASGAGYELYRRFEPNIIDTAINRSINIAAPDFKEKVRAIATTTDGVLQYAVPSGISMLDLGLVKVEFQTFTDPSQTTWPFQTLDPKDYEFIEDYDPATQTSIKTIQLRFLPFANRLLRFVYDGPLGNVATGTDYIHLDLPQLEWLYAQSVAELWRIEGSRTADSNRKAAYEEAARAEAFADKLRRQLAQEKQPRPLRRTTFTVI